MVPRMVTRKQKMHFGLQFSLSINFSKVPLRPSISVSRRWDSWKSLFLHGRIRSGKLQPWTLTLCFLKVAKSFAASWEPTKRHPEEMIRKEIIKKAIKKITDSRGVFVCLFCFVPFTRNAVWPRGNILFVSVPSTAHRSRGHFSFTCEATEPWRLPVTAPRPPALMLPSELN